jgi:hypothetical protein
LTAQRRFRRRSVAGILLEILLNYVVPRATKAGWPSTNGAKLIRQGLVGGAF